MSKEWPCRAGPYGHFWKRLPVTDFTVIYACECGARHKIQWANILPHVSAVDMKVTAAYGGTVNGDAGQPWEFTLSHRMVQIAELGLSLHVEELEPESDA